MIDAICPHCGRALLAAGIAAQRHIEYCLHAPAAQERVAAAMQAANRPGRGVASASYGKAARRLRAPGPGILIAAFGSWVAACAHFEFVAYVPGSAREPAALAEVAAAVEETQSVLAAERSGDRGLQVCGAREIDGGRRVAYMLR